VLSVCQLVNWSVGQSVSWSGGQSVSRSVGCFILHPSSFILHPSPFTLLPSSVDLLRADGANWSGMKINGVHYRTVWMEQNVVKMINQAVLPHFFRIEELQTHRDTARAIKDMIVRGAGAIGATAAYGMAQVILEAPDSSQFSDAVHSGFQTLANTRPTAQNLFYALDRVLSATRQAPSVKDARKIAIETANIVAEEDVSSCSSIGCHGAPLVKDGARVLTHCNAGWLACIDYGTATAPVYLAREKGIPVHVWVDETRPMNQGARLTSWELGKQGVPYTLIADNSGGHLMQKGMVDLVIVGCDRATAKGDVANKIGTYLKALAAFDNKVPFYAALPSSSFDLSISDGMKEIVVEEREPEEVTSVTGFSDGEIRTVRISPEDAKAGNWGFDITPARLVTGFITEKGICRATESDIRKIFSEK